MALSANQVAFLYQNPGAVVTPVIPEPMTMYALGLAVAGLGGYVRKRRRA